MISGGVGDFNHSISGDIVTSGRGRSGVQHALSDLELTAWDAVAPYAKSDPTKNELRATNLVCGVCGPSDVASAIVEVIPANGLSDHNGYVVTVDVG